MHVFPFIAALISLLAIIAPEPALACWPQVDQEPRPPIESPVALRIEALETATFPQSARAKILEVLKGPFRPGQEITLRTNGNMCDDYGRSIVKGSRGTISATPPNGQTPMLFSGYYEVKLADWRTREKARAVPRNRPARPLSDPRKWITENDYPSSAFRARREGAVRYRLYFGVNGRVSRCDIIQSSGHVDLDDATCENARRRAKFVPATNGNAVPVPGSLSYIYHWVIPRN